MHDNQPLTSIEAFALALVEASSRLSDVPAPSDAVEAAVAPEALIPAAE